MAKGGHQRDQRSRPRSGASIEVKSLHELSFYSREPSQFETVSFSGFTTVMAPSPDPGSTEALVKRLRDLGQTADVLNFANDIGRILFGPKKKRRHTDDSSRAPMPVVSELRSSTPQDGSEGLAGEW